MKKHTALFLILNFYALLTKSKLNLNANMEQLIWLGRPQNYLKTMSC